MNKKSLGQLLSDAETLQKAAKLTKSFSELNSTIVEILRWHLSDVTVRLDPKRSHAWEDRYAVLQVVVGNLILSIPVPELESQSRELAEQVRSKMNAKIEAALAARTMAEFENALGFGWFEFQGRLSAIVGYGPSWNRWVSGKTGIAYKSFYQFGQLFFEKGREVNTLWADKSGEEQAIIQAAGIWNTEAGVVMYFPDFRSQLQFKSVQGWNDPIKFPAADWTIRRRQILEAMEAAGHLGSEPSSVIMAAQESARQQVALRQQQREYKRQVEREAGNRTSRFIWSLIERAEPILVETRPLISNVATWWSPEIQIINFKEATGACQLKLSWKDEKSYSHSIFVNTTVHEIESAAKRIHEFFVNGGQVEDLFLHLK